jgi:hypothetical protein
LDFWWLGGGPHSVIVRRGDRPNEGKVCYANRARGDDKACGEPKLVRYRMRYFTKVERASFSFSHKIDLLRPLFKLNLEISDNNKNTATQQQSHFTSQKPLKMSELPKEIKALRSIIPFSLKLNKLEVCEEASTEDEHCP